MRDEHLQTIREACIKANPDAAYWGMPQGGDIKHARSPRLADVLLATEGEWQTFYSASLYGIKKTGEVEGAVLYSIVQKWNLRKDDLTEQSDECLAFLADLLAKDGDTV